MSDPLFFALLVFIAVIVVAVERWFSGYPPPLLPLLGVAISAAGLAYIVSLAQEFLFPGT